VNAIEAMKREIRYQVQDLRKVEPSSFSKNCLFVGSGDSYVAGRAAQYVSGNRALCCYPIDVIQNPSITNGRHLCFVSISGNTKANIVAAKIAKKRGIHTTAITRRPASQLAKTCDQVIELKYRSAGVTTAGTSSFTFSLLSCISLVKEVRMPSKLDKIFAEAENHARQAVGRIINKSSFIVLGNGILYPAATYGALKFNEIFGARAVSYPIDEFCHSPLFSVRNSDQIIIMGGDGEKLHERLSCGGLSSVHIGLKSVGIELLLKSIFFVQLLVLKLAEKWEPADCYFLKNTKLFKMSSDFIY
jgi:glutamine---fructose-6-phosphate transaminase (isomerizing)